MEGDNADMASSGGGSTSASSRWNPTKEQISMLESLYTQGIRTPNAEQIQQITSRLKAYGHIEGKNVFYWFQNHKARQRQKEKQESMAYINRYLHKVVQPAVFPAAPSPSVVCSPYYLPQNDLSFYPKYPKAVLPTSGYRRGRRAEKMDKARASGGAMYDHGHHGYDIMMQSSDNNEGNVAHNNGNANQQTLALFPLHPTGLLQGRSTGMRSFGLSEANTEVEGQGASDHQPFFDFFSRQGCRGTD